MLKLQKSSAFPLGSFWGRGHIEEELQQGLGWGCFEGSQLRAFLLLRDQVDRQEVTWLGTDPHFQGQGHMTRLLRKVIGHLNGRELWLEAHEKNQAALGLYQALGFEAVGQRNNYYSDGGSAQLFSYKPLQS